MSERAVIFDLGNVLVSFDHTRCHRALAAALGTTPDRVADFVEPALRPRFNLGELTIQELQSAVEGRFGARLDRPYFVQAWADVFDPIPEMISWPASLAGQVRLALLSNTDAIHLPWIRERYGFLHHFEHLILSYEVGAAKPAPAIYQAALDALGLAPSACIFVDDIGEYAAAARTMGMAAIHHTTPALTRQQVETWLKGAPGAPG